MKNRIRLKFDKIITRCWLCFLLFALCTSYSVGQVATSEPELPGGNNKWKLAWSDEFDYPDSVLDINWISENAVRNQYCGRWRENAKVMNGKLYLLNKKDYRGGRVWSTGSVKTKTQFKYGYFECKYKYGNAQGLNNAFWMMTQTPTVTVGKKYELDINEGRYPNARSTTVYNWTDVTIVDGKQVIPHETVFYWDGVNTGYNHQLNTPITTTKVRFVSTNPNFFHIPEIRVYAPNNLGYPDVMNADADTKIAGLVNLSKSATVSSSGVYNSDARFLEKYIADGKISTHWVSQDAGEKWVQLEWNNPVQIGCVQFLNGWINLGVWDYQITDYKLQYFNGSNWIDIGSYDVRNTNMNLALNYHTYGLEWNEKELIYYFDRQEIWRQTNDFCFSSSPMILSSCIVGTYAGEITDAIDGTSMEIEYVRMYNDAIETRTTEINDSIDELKSIKVNTRGNEVIIKSTRSYKVELFNTKGISVFTKQFDPGENTIGISTKGIYLAKLTNSKGVITKKISIL